MSWLGITHAGPDDDNHPEDHYDFPTASPSPWGWSLDPADRTRVCITDAQYEPVLYGECLNPCDLPLLTAAPELLDLVEQFVDTHGCDCGICDAARALIVRVGRED